MAKRYIVSVLMAALGLALSLTILVSSAAPPAPKIKKATAAAVGASVSTKVQVPASMRSGSFSTDRYLNLPPDFSVAVYARIGGARFMAAAPNGDLLVSVPGSGKVVLVRPNPNGDPQVTDFVTGLRNPHDIVFHTIGSTIYLYITESNQINRYVYNPGDTTAHDRQVIISGLPDASSPELGGNYGHQLKNIALDSNDKLYLSVASRSNADPALDPQDGSTDPIRGTIYQYNADGTGKRLFAKGLRNAEGLAMLPGTTDLWVAVNNRDNIGCPDTSNPACTSTGQVVTAYVDNHPPEEFTKIRDGGNYGWPFCNPNPDSASGYDNMPFDRDIQNNADGSKLNCDTADRINKGIQAHSAPLGLLFLQDTNFAEPYRNGAVIGLHGSWNRSVKTGYKVIYFPWDNTTQTPGAQMDLANGWVNPSTGEVWGRPVDIAVDPQGNMFISDDQAGAVYKLTYTATTPTPTPTVTSTPVPTTPGPTATPTATPSGSGTGLTGEYFANKTLTGTAVLSRLDSTVNFSWGQNVPGPGVPKDNFSVRWTGTVKAPTTETYNFCTLSDDGIRLWVNGSLIINNWTDHSKTENCGAINLTQDQFYSVKLEFYDNLWDAVAILQWQTPTIAKQVVPQAQLYSDAASSGPTPTPTPTLVPTATPAPTPTPTTPPAGVGTGLTGEYFANKTVTGTAVLRRLDSTVNFNWGQNSPGAGVPKDGFSVRWSGLVKASTTEAYNFCTTSDDGIRLWINGTLVINNWTDHAKTENCGTINLSQDQFYSLKLEFYDDLWDAIAILQWQTPTIAKQVVPQAQLYPDASNPGPTPTPVPTNTPTPTPSDTPTPTLTPTATATVTATATPSPAPSGRFSVKINFQPGASAVPAGYLKDDGSVYANRNNGFTYGWTITNTANTRDRNATNSPDQRYDTLIHMQKTDNPNAIWQIAVPNGNYQVRIVAGDPTAIDSVFKINVEGVLTISGTPTSANRWLDATKTVTVSDSKLTVSNASGASNNKICFIEITQVS